MKQVDFQLIDPSSLTFGEISPAEKQNEHLIIGNLVFESNPLSQQQISEEDYYNSVLSSKQNALPISCILEKKQKGIIESFYSQKRCQYNSPKELVKKIKNMDLEQQYVLQNYLNVAQNAHSCQAIQNENNTSDSGSNFSRGSFSSSFEIESKESAFAYFIERELGNFQNNTGVNGKSQIFSYTIVQCLEDELEPYILRKGISEAYISILGSNRNHYQQMMMRIGTQEPRSAETRRQVNLQLLKSHLQCYETSKLAPSDPYLQQSSSQNSQYPSILPISPLITQSQSSIETLEKIILNCNITTSVIPCIVNGSLLGFIQFQFYAFQAPVVKKLMSDRRVNKFQIPNFWNEQEYNIKSELFIQKMELYNV